MASTEDEYQQRIQQFIDDFNCLRNEVSKMIVGYEDVIEKTLTCLLAGGNVLLEQSPVRPRRLAAHRPTKALLEVAHCLSLDGPTANLLPPDWWPHATVVSVLDRALAALDLGLQIDVVPDLRHGLPGDNLSRQRAPDLDDLGGQPLAIAPQHPVPCRPVDTPREPWSPRSTG